MLIPDLPADLVKQGDTLRMFLAAKPAGAFAPHTVSQTLVLTGVDGLVLFTANLWAGATPAPTTKASIPAVPFNLLPDLGRWGVQLLDAGPLCTSLVPAGDLCPLVRRVVSATWMGKSGTAPSGATLDLGSLRLFVGRLDHVLSEGGCDGFSNTRLAGFVAAAP